MRDFLGCIFKSTPSICIYSYLSVHVSEVAAPADNMPTSLTNSLTHHFPLSTVHRCQKHVSVHSAKHEHFQKVSMKRSLNSAL